MPATTRHAKIAKIKEEPDTHEASKFLETKPSATPSPSSPPSKSTAEPTTTKRKSRDTLIQPPSTALPTPSLTSPSINYTYAIARGEQGVLTYEPYKSLILPFWAFRTVPIAQASASALMSIFHSYVARGDLVGADMTRKFIQMGMTRARRYANHKGGRKYDAKTGEVLEKWSGEGVGGEEGRKRREKEEASELFKGYWRRCIEDEGYLALKARWQREKQEWRSEGKLAAKEMIARRRL
ncbi:uncharacterized protein AB675_4195 [Cyphellophora attinorum]|uniref:Uncharacterized protein n=1 Tax=Cyphellophora attinorum TaxID=1664694 RepID=A0A0N1NXH0_9EURO|nr:uncharacterized protein AB675_4195 [Phialophora attinorum]KPI38473.1 hypothetical protein AB675_4195 [Phialophora attinorum]